MAGRGVTEAFTNGASCSARRGGALAPDYPRTLVAGEKGRRRHRDPDGAPAASEAKALLAELGF
jgi:hypothetical protein